MLPYHASRRFAVVKSLSHLYLTIQFNGSLNLGGTNGVDCAVKKDTSLCTYQIKKIILYLLAIVKHVCVGLNGSNTA